MADNPLPRKKISRRVIVQTAVGLILMVALLWYVNPAEVIRLVAEADPLFLAVAVFSVVADRFLMAYKWNLLVRAKGINLSMARAFKITMVSAFFGLFMPMAVGADIFKAYYASAGQRYGARIAATVLLEKILGMVGIGAAAVVGVLIMSFELKSSFFTGAGAIGIAGFFILSSFVVWGLLQRRGLAFVIYLLRRLKWQHTKLARLTLRCQSALVSFRRRKGLLVVFTVLTVFELWIYSITTYFSALALGLDLQPLIFLGIIPACRMLIKLPVSIDAVGIQEGLYVFFFAMVGVTAAQSLTMSVLVRIATYVALGSGGIVYVIEGWRTPRSKTPKPMVRDSL